jgi:DNA-binding CsgD family transcriptional regulator
MRLSGISADVFSPCQAIIVLIDPDIPFQSTEAVLRNCLGLTTAEAKLALKLATGESLETAAEQTGITRVTARNQLKSIFAKTDTHRQAELILLVMKLGSQYLQHHRPATDNMRIGTDFDLC